MGFYSLSIPKADTESDITNYVTQVVVDVLSLDENGWLTFEVFTLLDKLDIIGKLAQAAYRDIRDIYHTHTHHVTDDADGAADSLTKCYRCTTNEEAARKIIESFLTRNVEYRDSIESYIFGPYNSDNFKSPAFFYTIYALAKQADGELFYARSFCRHVDYDTKKEHLPQCH